MKKNTWYLAGWISASLALFFDADLVVMFIFLTFGLLLMDLFERAGEFERRCRPTLPGHGVEKLNTWYLDKISEVR